MSVKTKREVFAIQQMCLMASNATDRVFLYTVTDALNDTNEDLFPVPRSPLLDALNTIISCLTLLSNGLVIIMMLVRRRVFRSFTNRLIFHQSVIDAITGMVFFFHRVVKGPGMSFSSEKQLFNELLCRLIYSDALLWWLYVTSTYNLVIISLERFVATCYPVKYRNSWSKSKLKFAVGTSWTIGFMYALSIPFLHETHEGLCQFTGNSQGLAVVSTLFLVGIGIDYVVPVIIIIYAYTSALLALTKKLANSMPGRQTFHQKARRNLLTTTLLTGIMFIVCWTPLEVQFTILAVNRALWSETVYNALTTLLSINMCVNPIIYCFQYEHFRSQLTEMVNLKRFRKNRVQASGERPLPLAIISSQVLLDPVALQV